jgi:hypothetical protein
MEVVSTDPAPDPSRGLFILGKNTIVLGFMPHLMDGEEGKGLRELLLEEVALQLRFN